MTNPADKLAANQIKVWLRENISDTSVDQFVVDAMLNALESKVCETEFIEFCGELEAVL